MGNTISYVIHFFYLCLTTASQSGGWVPETSRSFHYWQPAPRWRPLPWLANPGNPAMSPHAEGEKKTKNRHPSWTLIKQWKEKGRDRGGETASKESPRSGENANARNADLNAIQTLQCSVAQEHEESWRMRIYNKPLTARVKLMLLVVNSVKLHLTAKVLTERFVIMVIEWSTFYFKNSKIVQQKFNLKSQVWFQTKLLSTQFNCHFITSILKLHNFIVTRWQDFWSVPKFAKQWLFSLSFPCNAIS